MIRIEIARPHHVTSIVPRMIFQANLEIKTQVMVSIFSDQSRVLIADTGKVLAIIGATKLWAGVYEFWALTSDIPSKYRVSFARIVKEHLAFFCMDQIVRRAQMVVREGYLIEMRFAEYLGFQREGLLRGYGPEGANYHMYGRVF